MSPVSLSKAEGGLTAILDINFSPPHNRSHVPAQMCMLTFTHRCPQCTGVHTCMHKHTYSSLSTHMWLKNVKIKLGLFRTPHEPWKRVTTFLRLLTHAGTGTFKTFVEYGKILIIVTKGFSQGNHDRYCEGMLTALSSVMFG